MVVLYTHEWGYGGAVVKSKEIDQLSGVNQSAYIFVPVCES